MDMIKIIEKELNSSANYTYMDIQPGDVEKTYADIGHSEKLLNYNPKTSIHEGIPKFINWYKDYRL